MLNVENYTKSEKELEVIRDRTEPDELQVRINRELLQAFLSTGDFKQLRERISKEFVISLAEVDTRIAIFEKSFGVRFSFKAGNAVAGLDDDGIFDKVVGTALDGLLPEKVSLWKRLKSSNELEFEVLPGSAFAVAWGKDAERLSAVGCRVFRDAEDKIWCRINFELLPK